MYNAKVLDHFQNPRNAGDMPDADGVGEVVNESCGDATKIYIKVKDGRIADIRFQTFGCAAAIATSSILTELVKGKSIEEALAVTESEVVKSLDGLPPKKVHCSNLAAGALRAAILDFKERHGR